MDTSPLASSEWPRGRRPGVFLEQLGRCGIGIAAALVASVLLSWADAKVELAAVALLLVVVGTGLLGYAAGLATAAVGFLLLLYFFTPPTGHLFVHNVSDLVVGVAFLVGSLTTGLVVARLDELRRRSARTAREAEIRLMIVDRVVDGVAPDALMDAIAHQVVSVFNLSGCRIVSPEHEVEVTTDGGPWTNRHPDDDVEFATPSLTMVVSGARRLGLDERATLRALAASLALGLDRMRLESEASDSRIDAELARSRAAFLAAVTHDLRTPLATIKAATAALLVDGSPLSDAERHELIETANADAADLDDLVTKVLEFTSIRSGALPALREVSADDVVHAAVRRARRTLGTRTLVIATADDAPNVHVDLVMVEHALGNLLENAARYAPEGTEITLATATTDDLVEFRVIDHGPGVPPEDRARVFDEFVRLGSEARRGFGLGLTIVRVLVEAHNGDVWCEATPGGGATFVIALPRDGVRAALA